MYTVIINQDALHLKVCLFTIFLVFEFDERILEAFPGALVSNDFTGNYRTETAENGIQVLV